MIYILIILGLATLLYFLGYKSVHHEITIHTSPEKEWNVLTDADKYDSWNPVMKLLEGKISEGNKVKYQFTQEADNKYDIGSTVKKVVPLKLLNQGGGIPFILSFNHKYILEPVERGTKLTIHEDYKGIGVNFWNPKPV
ncbi:MAG: SRPBCC domain-containing protein [Bacteroidota bacterium]